MDDSSYEKLLKHRGRDSRHVAVGFWFLVCVIVLLIWSMRVLGWWRRRNLKFDERPRHTHFSAWLEKKIALLKGICLTSLSIWKITLGRFLVLTVYTFLIITLLLSVSHTSSAFDFIDDVAFRAAWTTVSQIPLVYLLSTKRGPLNYLTGLSYERINWLHRWVGRMIFVSATTHMVIMLSSISISELLRSRENAMQVVRYGAGAYVTLLWIAVSSIISVRKRWYRFFYVNHWAATMFLLGMIWMHVPSYAKLPIYVSATIVWADKGLAALRYLLNNVTTRPLKRRSRRGDRSSSEIHVLAMGHSVKMMAPVIAGEGTGAIESTTVIRMCDLPFKWQPGQHIRMYLPRLGALEIHPFTPATCSYVSPKYSPAQQDVEQHGLLPNSSAPQTNDMILMIKTHDGWTKRLAQYYKDWRSLPCPNASRPSSSLIAFLDGPYGNAPAWQEYENIIMLSTSTGVSFMLSILSYLEQLCLANLEQLRTRRIRFVWANRHIEPHFEATVTELLCKNSAALRESGILVEAEIYISCLDAREPSATTPTRDHDPFAHLRRPRRNYFSGKSPLRIRNPNAPHDNEDDGNLGRELEHSSFVLDDLGSRSSEETYVENEDQRPCLAVEEQRPCLSELTVVQEELNKSFWTRLNIPRWRMRERASPESCQCSILRYQERKCNTKRPPPFVSKYYGERPDVPGIVASSVSSESRENTMITVCGSKIGGEAKKMASKMILEFAMGRRQRGVDFHAEVF